MKKLHTKRSIYVNGGQNARTCPYKDEDVPHNQALWVKFDELTEGEATELHVKMIKSKGKIAPKARGTSVKAEMGELPGLIKDELKLCGGGNGSEKK